MGLLWCSRCLDGDGQLYPKAFSDATTDGAELTCPAVVAEDVVGLEAQLLALQASSGRAICDVAILFASSVAAVRFGYTSKWMCGQRPA